jgi:nucleoside-diphosphate kinase
MTLQNSNQTPNQHHKHERTFTIIKPDGVQRTLIGEIIQRYERIGLKLVAMKLMVPTEDMVKKHYTLDAGWKQAVGEKSIKGFLDKGQTPPSNDPLEIAEKILNRLAKYLTSGPVIAMVWQGAHAVKVVRKITGGTEPLTSDMGTIRGDFVLDSYQMSETDDRSIRNLVHASGSVQEAEDEIAHWFKPEEIVDYRLVQEKIMYSADMDDIFG